MTPDLHSLIQTDFFFLEVHTLNGGNLAMDPFGNQVLNQLFNHFFLYLCFIKSCRGQTLNESACLLSNNFRRIVNG